MTSFTCHWLSAASQCTDLTPRNPAKLEFVAHPESGLINGGHYPFLRFMHYQWQISLLPVLSFELAKCCKLLDRCFVVNKTFAPDETRTRAPPLCWPYRNAIHHYATGAVWSNAEWARKKGRAFRRPKICYKNCFAKFHTWEKLFYTARCFSCHVCSFLMGPGSDSCNFFCIHYSGSDVFVEEICVKALHISCDSSASRGHSVLRFLLRPVTSFLFFVTRSLQVHKGALLSMENKVALRVPYKKAVCKDCASSMWAL